MKKLIPILIAAMLLCCIPLAGCNEGEAGGAGKTIPTDAPAAVTEAPTQAPTELDYKARFDGAVSYVEDHLDVSKYKKEEDNNAEACRITWQNPDYTELKSPLAATVGGYEIVLGKTTYKDLLDHGFSYKKTELDTNEAPFYATLQKNGEIVTFIGSSDAKDKDSSVISYIFLVGDNSTLLQDGDKPADFDLRGLKLGDDLAKAYDTIGAPNEIMAYSASAGDRAALHMTYPVGDSTLTISHWYDNNGGTYLSSIEMRLNQI